MKNIYIRFLVLLLAVTTTACGDLFDVVPFDQMDKDKTYSNERNVNAALNGLYLELAQDALYGKELSFGMIEAMAQHYLTPSKHHYYYIAQYEYSQVDAEGMLNSVWTGAYRLIAQCNEFLYEIEQRKDRFPEWKYDIYRGEAIAIRTMLHFDMLRLFGPVYQRDMTTPAIPYYDESTYVASPLLSNQEIMAKLLADVDEALNCLKNDPILETGLNMDEDSEDSDAFFTTFRNFRMNIYAVSILKARMCLYIGDDANKAEAYRITTAILEDKNPLNASKTTDFSSLFAFRHSPFNYDDERMGSDYVLFQEVIFGIQNTQRDRLQSDNFVSTLSNTKILAGGKPFYNYLYDTENGIVGKDNSIRKEIWQWNNNLEMNVMLKYMTNIDSYTGQTQCMMRLGEVFLIASEAAPDTESKRYWVEQLRIFRGQTADNAAGLEDFQLRELIYMELTKETYGEGQAFFAAKRNFHYDFLDQDKNSVQMNSSKFTPPLPKSETNYRDEKE
ncbi:RagB/SusD family nutrient uptake outer membrane protein [Alistipes sp. OttesenSCG-928-B03]|nr:RagB/SusD family nutrient uptake outer membrane protein [Alistipes sp. OttesenSCG-928-B03]